MIYIGSDHRGFELKEELKDFMKASKIEFVDAGPKKREPEDDFPVYSEKVAQRVSRNPSKDKGILICGSGHGVCIAANKFKNVRAGLCWNELVAQSSRRDDDTNVLCLPSDYVSAEVAEHILEIWLNTPFANQEKYVRRLKEIRRFEN